MSAADASDPAKRTVRIHAGDAGARLDRFLVAHFPSWSRNQLASAVREGHVLVNGRKARPGQALAAGDRLELPAWTQLFDAAAAERQETSRAGRRASTVRVVHRDDLLLVVDKPAGLAVHAGTGIGKYETLVELLVEDILAGFGLVHRLDRDTTGLICLVRGAEARRLMAESFASGAGVQKTYEAIVSGTPLEAEGVIDAPLRPPPLRGRAEVDVARGRPATTRWLVVERFTRAARLRLEPETGRTHQLRAHLRHIGHALLVDPLYGGRSALRLPDPRGGKALHLRRTPLHASKLAFAHPLDGRPLQFESPLPPDMQAVLERLRIVTARGLERGGLPPPRGPAQPPPGDEEADEGDSFDDWQS